MEPRGQRHTTSPNASNPMVKLVKTTILRRVVVPSSLVGT